MKALKSARTAIVIVALIALNAGLSACTTASTSSIPPSFAKEHEDLKAENSNLVAENKDLAAITVRLLVTNSELAIENKNLVVANAGLVGRNSKLMNEKRSLNAKNKGLIEENTRLKGDDALATLADENARMRGELKAVDKIARKIRRKTILGVSLNVFATPFEAIPFAGGAAIGLVTVAEISLDCWILKDLSKLHKVVGKRPIDKGEKEVCGINFSTIKRWLDRGLTAFNLWRNFRNWFDWGGDEADSEETPAEEDESGDSRWKKFWDWMFPDDESPETTG